MTKSARLVIILGVLLGGSVSILPNQTSNATTSITSVTDNVEATVNGYLAFTAINHTPGTGTTYTDATNTYSATYSLMDSTENFGVTTYQVTCNYISDPNPDVSERLSGNCSNGWEVNAESVSASDGYAAMVPSDNTNPFRIKSTSPATNPLSGTTANWVMKINGVSKTVGTQTFSSSAATGYNVFHLIPATNNSQKVAEGNTFRTVNSVANTYIGTETFEAQYGFTAGMDAVADSYTGSVTYTLHIKTN
ncbi:hypothetical protein IKF81_00740 [Candidatus Saccharibacteria bacterium]|nr:hypothetical protein [Candidatus Saccharibacteria bacterium]